VVAQKIDRVVIDTNVVVSALLFGGSPGELIPLWQSGILKPLASRQIVDEYVRLLAYPRFRLTEEEIQYLLYGEVLPYFDVVTVRPSKKVIVEADPADDKFTLCARAAAAGVIISGDRHLLALKSCQASVILSPAEFISRLNR